LTKTGRAIDKHGGRAGSVFPKPVGNIAKKNMQCQFHLDDILTHPKSTYYPNRFGEGIFFPQMVEEFDLMQKITLPVFCNLEGLIK